MCEASEWEVLWSRTYRASDADQLDPYYRGKYETLFATWFRGQPEAILHSMLCKQCGFVSVGPRPTEEEVDAKYRYSASLNLPNQWPPPDHPMELRRAGEVYRALRGCIRGKRARILDFGGNDGRMMRHFLERGHACFVVDYEENLIPGVHHAGQSLGDLDSWEPFDVIVAINVLEHLAAPRKVLQRLRAKLATDGWLYVEVPLEVYGQAKLPRDPVMHVNFFTPETLGFLLRRCGFEPSYCRLAGVDAGTFCRLAIRALAKKSEPAAYVNYAGGVEATRRYLSPSFLLRLRRLLFFPRRVPARVVAHLRAAACRRLASK